MWRYWVQHFLMLVSNGLRFRLASIVSTLTGISFWDIVTGEKKAPVLLLRFYAWAYRFRLEKKTK